MKILNKLSKKNSNIESCAAVTIAFLGDSITQGCFELNKGYKSDIEVTNDYNAVYHSQLKNMLNIIFPNAPINIINVGISGNIARQGYNRLERDILPYSPDLVVICFGLNDACNGIENIDKYVDALQGIFRKLKENDTEIIFMTPNMMNTYVNPLVTPESAFDLAAISADIQNNGIMNKYMDAAINLCSKESIPVCNCYEKWQKLNRSGVDTTKLLSNYINHPTREMHKLFAYELFEKIILDEE